MGKRGRRDGSRKAEVRGRIKNQESRIKNQDAREEGERLTIEDC
jgi:hypothetical protein